ncbi:PREDICTED: calcium-activated potassium channel subunit alpha-1-like [Thamnophis sirtalis]|uniref:Calcium-activated potassium channel subunit alpha-1-like n=1 Tax=Thamnophis sirtalis TaxID=35019 RepID=A0A6I9XP27_9SAUR|nr:PREDICTED: calcium-activated potassium channel subunit alpha-1-like [Thamnophis sirtalis]
MIRDLLIDCKNQKSGAATCKVLLVSQKNRKKHTYHNYHVLALLQTLVTGGTSPDLEEYLEEGSSLTSNHSNALFLGLRNRCKLALLTLVDDPELMEGLRLFFGDVFIKALDMYGILCLGIYRLKPHPNPYEIRKV